VNRKKILRGRGGGWGLRSWAQTKQIQEKKKTKKRIHQKHEPKKNPEKKRLHTILSENIKKRKKKNHEKKKIICI